MESQINKAMLTENETRTIDKFRFLNRNNQRAVEQFLHAHYINQYIEQQDEQIREKPWEYHYFLYGLYSSVCDISSMSDIPCDASAYRIVIKKDLSWGRFSVTITNMDSLLYECEGRENVEPLLHEAIVASIAELRPRPSWASSDECDEEVINGTV
jgi:hypothetical protein